MPAPKSETLLAVRLGIICFGDLHDGILKRAITTTKYEGKPQLISWLGTQLGRFWQQHYPQKMNVTVVPMPMHASKQKQQGFNQAEVIARTFIQVNRLPYQPKAFSRTKATKALFHLDLQQRQKEIRGAFTLKPAAIKALKYRPVLLLDDVYTCGTVPPQKKPNMLFTNRGLVVLASQRSLPQNPYPVIRETKPTLIRQIQRILPKAIV